MTDIPDREITGKSQADLVHDWAIDNLVRRSTDTPTPQGEVR